MRGSVLLGGAAVLALLLVACSDREGAKPDRTQPPAPTATPTPVPLTLTLEQTTEAHQGYVAALTAYVRRLEVPVAATIEVDFGDGQRAIIAVDESGQAILEHTYLQGGAFTVTALATATGHVPATTTATIDVLPRRILFVQGMNSSSRCPDGGGFNSRAPEWLARHLLVPDNVGGMVFTPASFIYFSYSDEWCNGSNGADGAAANYDASDTCGSIDAGYGDELRHLVDRLSPGRVTIVAHSMGGLVAAYAAASDPDWARAHIASIATFDSPLRGVNFFRASVLGAGGMFDDDCGLGSEAVEDLDEGSYVVRTVKEAAKVVPFYTADATDGEEIAFRRMEAVPEGDTTLEGAVLRVHFDDDHADVWTHEGEEMSRKQRFVVCAVAIARADCLPE